MYYKPTISVNKVRHDKVIVKNLHEMVTYYLTEEQKRADTILKKLTLKHLELTEIFDKNKDTEIDSLLKSTKKITEDDFLNDADVALIDKNLIITDTTLETEKGLYLKLFEDARKSAEVVLKKNDKNYVNVSFSVYCPA